LSETKRKKKGDGKFPIKKIQLADFDRGGRITEHIFVVKEKKSLPTYPLPKLWVG
jgi:hypothetical protein